MQKILLWLDKTWSRIILALLACGIGFFIGIGFLVEGFEEKIYENRRLELQRITDLALNTVQPVLDAQKAGKLSREEALNEIRAIIRRMVFWDLYGQNYVFMSSYDGIMLVQPFEPSREGTNQINLQDAYGLQIIQALIGKAREGGGFVTYYYHPAERSEPQKKISYVIGIPELRVYIGSGMYVEDIQTSYRRFLSTLLGVSLLVIGLIIGAQYFILRPMFRSYQSLTDAFTRLNRNFDPRARLSLDGYRSGSEAERLLTGFNQLLREIENKTESLRQSELMFRTLFECANDAICVIRDGVIIDCNRHMELLFTLPRKEILGKRPEELSPSIQLDGIESRDKAKWIIDTVLQGEAKVFEWLHTRQGREFETEVSLGRFDIEGSAFLLAIIRDISERKEAEARLQEIHEELLANHEELERNNQDLKEREEQIRHMAYHDTLTGLANRRFINERLHESLGAQGDKKQGAILFFDLDHFKVINDSCGHAVGDHVLISIADALRGEFGGKHCLARFGGDEFIILLEGVNQVRDIERFAENLRRLLSRQLEVGGHSFTISASIGIVQYPQHGQDVEELLKNADTALFEAKRAGRNNWKFFTPAMRKAIIQRLILEQHLREAVETENFTLHFQPIVDVAGAGICGFEALLRWRHPQQGPISPLTFIPIAEESGLIIPIGDWVLKNAAKFGVKLLNLGYSDLFVAVNISPKQLTRHDFPATVRAALQQTGLAANRLKLEITETALMDSVEDVVDKLSELKDMGVQLSIDDFGTGYSSLTYLRKLPIHIVKIDKSFIDDMVSGTKTIGIMGSIIDLAHQLGLKVVAEGVESVEQRRILEEHGCDMLQGYQISKPLPETEALAFLHDYDGK